MLYKLCLIVNVGLVFYKGSCERLILSLAVRLSLFLYWLHFILSVFYEQINDDDDDGGDTNYMPSSGVAFAVTGVQLSQCQRLCDGSQHEWPCATNECRGCFWDIVCERPPESWYGDDMESMIHNRTRRWRYRWLCIDSDFCRYCKVTV